MSLDFFRRLADPLGAKAARARERALLEAAMASAALVAGADAGAGLAKRLRLDQILDGVDSLRGADPHIAVEIFEDFAGALRADPKAGRDRALAAVAGFAGAPDTARLLLHIARAMATAGGGETAAARAELAAIAQTLGLAATPAAGCTPEPKAGPRTLIALGNEKGGSGKSTTAMHLAVALLRRGHAVGTIDLDGHQGTLSGYVANRTRRAEAPEAEQPRLDLALPKHRRVVPSDLRNRDTAHAEERAALAAALEDLADCRYVILDAPGSLSNLSRLGHEVADILVTPLNDSFLDLDVLARLDHARREVVEPSAYGRRVLEENARRAAQGRPALDWIVMRNRLAQIDARNTREMERLLGQLGRRMGFRTHPGLSERVIFRELFYEGLTLLDLAPASNGAAAAIPLAAPSATGSHQRARRELDDLVSALCPPAAAASGAGNGTAA